MKKSIKLVSAILTIALLLCLISGCSAVQKRESLLVGIITAASSRHFYETYVGLKNAIDASTLEREVLLDSHGAPSGPILDLETAKGIAKTMVEKKYDLIIAIGAVPAIAARAATENSKIPVVFCAMTDPVGFDIVNSLDAPGVNCTGVNELFDFKSQFETIQLFQADAKDIGVLYTIDDEQSLSQLARMKEIAAEFSFNIVEQAVTADSDIKQIAAELCEKVDCIATFNDDNILFHFKEVSDAADAAGIHIYSSSSDKGYGACIAYVISDYEGIGKTTGEMVLRILGGERAKTIPVVTFDKGTVITVGPRMEELGIELPEKNTD